MMKRAAFAFATSVAFAGNAAADPQPLTTVLSGIHGQEVRLAGQFGHPHGERNSYQIDTGDGTFRVEMAVNREQLKSVQGCQFALLSDDKSCGVEMLAEIKVDGSAIKLIAYQITRK